MELIKLSRTDGYNLVFSSSMPPKYRGDSTPSGDGIIVDMSRMKKIVHMDRRNKVAIIEPGVTFSELIAEVDNAGLKVLMPLLCTEMVFGTGDLFRTGTAAVLDCYAFQSLENQGTMPWVVRPVVVALPVSTEEVQALVRICNRQGLKYKAFSTGWGAWCGPTTDNVVQIDLRRMNRILEIDEKNMYAVVEPYVCGAQLQAEAMKVGLNTHIIGAGPNCSPLASATSGWGVGHDGIYMSYSPRNLLGLEWVQPTGEILRLGAPGSGKGWFCGDGPGPSLRGTMRGYFGALSGMGVFTK
jgi:FAD/FMN-containing dehydrogenase